MTVQLRNGGLPNPAPTFRDARVNRIVRILDSYGVLTRRAIFELCHADHWGGGTPFPVAVERAIRSGRARALGDELLEAVGRHDPPPSLP